LKPLLAMIVVGLTQRPLGSRTPRLTALARNGAMTQIATDPALSAPKLAIGKRLLLRKLGFRSLMDVTPLDASLVRGSHGRITDRPEDGPLLIASRADLLAREKVAATDLKSLLLDAVFS
jgi:hypothetical protein